MVSVMAVSYINVRSTPLLAAVILYFNLIYVRKVTKAFWNVIALMCFCAPILLPKKDGGNTFIYYI